MGSRELRRIGFADVKGGGQVTVVGDLCFIGHLQPPLGTTILDVSDPRQPRLVGQTTVPMDTHSHKVRAHDGIMLVNNEAHKNAPGDARGLRIFDIARPEAPREIAFHRTGGKGVHRFDFDGRYAYLSAEMEGFKGYITLILDLADPVRPREVSRWWVPGQWVAGGETPPPSGRHQVHHPLRFGDYLYVGCCNAGLALVDVSDLSRPTTVASHPLHGLFTHTVLPSEATPRPEDMVIAVDEGWWDLEGGVTVADLSNRAEPQVVARYDLAPGGPERRIWAAHQPHEKVIDGLLYVAWFAHGLRVLDVRQPAAPVEVASWVPEERSESGVMSNDVFVDAGTGRIYLIDRTSGLDILELA